MADLDAVQRAQMRKVVVRPRGIDHKKQVIALVGDHQVVQHAALIGGEQTISLPPRPQPDEVGGHQRLKRRGGVAAGTAQDHLAHVADVEQPGLAAGMQMLGHHARRILHRHRPARERHHARAIRHVKVMQRRLQQFGHGIPRLHLAGASLAPVPDAPSVPAPAGRLRSLSRRRARHPTRNRRRSPEFRHGRRSMRLRVYRGGCSFGPGPAVPRRPGVSRRPW